jgi:hypothetical protein
MPAHCKEWFAAARGFCIKRPLGAAGGAIVF